ncbi:hypothetical protein QR680_015403 [Steinernema hermaphroditum]|uniref:Tyrosine-protein kinase n=1 Tax=Steinernema hermaphroditum TaxID=289476 RepID=A0AA39H7T7_9BILA|nr:hypothetical protein QR680_015403 [Steinernema hermaphroditum]
MSSDRSGAKSFLQRVKHIFSSKKSGTETSYSAELLNDAGVDDGPSKSIMTIPNSMESLAAPSFLPSGGASKGTAESGFIEHQPYYHGFLPRDDALLLLEKPGDFLVRQTDVNQHGRAFVISVRCALGNVEHIVLYRTKDDQRWMGCGAVRFDTIPQLVDYYKKRSINEKSTQLIHGIPRQWWQLYNDQIHLEKALGSGQYGEVWLGTFKFTMACTPFPVAVKLLRSGAASKKEDRVQLIKEARLSQSFHHLNVVSVYGVAMQREPIMIVMELADGGSLLKLLRERGTSLSLTRHIELALEASSGLEYLEKMKCVHRDIAARNCLMSTVNDKLVVKISDFGLSTIGEAKIDDPTTKMAIRWLAPEVLTDFAFSHKSDVWAFGVLLYEIFSDGDVPYPGFSNQEVRDKVMSMYRMEPPRTTPKLIAELIQACWQQNPKDRPDFRHVCKRLKKCLKAFQ